MGHLIIKFLKMHTWQINLWRKLKKAIICLIFIFQSCKSLNDSKLYRIKIKDFEWVIFYLIEWFRNEFPTLTFFYPPFKCEIYISHPLNVKYIFLTQINWYQPFCYFREGYTTHSFLGVVMSIGKLVTVGWHWLSYFKKQLVFNNTKLQGPKAFSKLVRSLQGRFC